MPSWARQVARGSKGWLAPQHGLTVPAETAQGPVLSPSTFLSNGHVDIELPGIF